MANEEHLAILNRGVDAWNEWRKASPEVVPDLENASLSRMNLQKVNLSWARLRLTELRNASLEEASLSSANLIGTKLSEANLSHADLSWAYVGQADLSGADLSHAKLYAANLVGVDLSGANLRGANLRATKLTRSNLSGANVSTASVGANALAGVDLSTVVDLEEVRHIGPTSLGIDTIYLSQGKIPEVFLRGAGVPEPFIVQTKALIGAMEPIQFYSCFISYSTKNSEFAERLHADLQIKNVRCWFAPDNLKTGDEIRPSIDEAIRIYDKLLIVLSGDPVRSPWVRKEVETAFAKEMRVETQLKERRTVLFPIRLDDAVMETEEAWAADIRRTRHIGDFTGWKDHDNYKTAFERLLRDLETATTGS